MRFEARRMFWKLALAVALAPLWAGAAETRDARTHFFSLGVGDLKAELAEARANGRQGLLIMFEQEGCPACIHMNRNVLSRRDVQDFYRKHFVNLPVDVFGSIPLTDFSGRDTTEKDYAKTVKVRVTPTFVFYDLNGAEIIRTTGSMPAEDFLVLGRYVATGAYKTRTLAQFRKNPG